jgi:hypothetical protein
MVPERYIRNRLSMQTKWKCFQDKFRAPLWWKTNVLQNEHTTPLRTTVWVRDNRVWTLNWISDLQVPSILKVSFTLTTEFGKVVLNYISENTTVQCYWHYQTLEGHFVKVFTGELYIYKIFTNVYKFCIR